MSNELEQIDSNTLCVLQHSADTVGKIELVKLKHKTLELEIQKQLNELKLHG